MSQDFALSVSHKNLFGLDNITTYSDSNALGFKSITIQSGIYVSSISLVQSNTLVYQDINISNNCFISNNLYSSNLSVIKNLQTDTLSVQNLLIRNTCVSNQLFCYNNVANNLLGNNFIVNYSTIVPNSNINNFLPINDTININSNNINIGNSNSIISLYGTTISSIATDVNLSNKIINLNYNSNPSNIDSGFYGGIYLYGNTNISFIRLNSNASRFETNLGGKLGYVSLFDNSFNFLVSGTTNINNDSTINSNLNINKNFSSDNITVLSSLRIKNSLYSNDCISNSNININSNGLFINVTTNTHFLTTNGIITNLTNNSILNTNSLLTEFVSIGSNLIGLNNLRINNNLSIASNIYTDSIYAINTSVDSDLYSTNIIGNSVRVNKNISGNDFYSLNSTVGSSIQVVSFNPVGIYGNVSIMSNLSSNLLIISKLDDYDSNIDAIKNGVPFWGLYRTGDNVKICIPNTPPRILLSGSSDIVLTTTSKISANTSFNEPGAISYDYINNILNTFVYSINDGTNEYVSNIIPITSTSTINSYISILGSTVFTLTYGAIDNFNNYAFVQRTVRSLYIPPLQQFIAFLLDYNIVTSFTAMDPLKPIQYNSVTKLWNWNPIYWQPYTITSISPNITISGYNNSTLYFPYGRHATLANPITNLPTVVSPAVSLVGIYPFYITPSYKTLEDIKFSYTKSWTFVTKIKHRNGDTWAENLDIMFDSIASGNPPAGNSWTTKYTIRLLYGSIQLIQTWMAGISFSYSISGIFGTFSGSGIGRNEYWNFKTTNQIGNIGWIATGFFVVISHDRSTFTTSVIFINNAGTTLATINISTPNTNYYASTIANGIPFAIQVPQNPMQFYEGFVYAAASTITYSTIVSLFPTGSTFA